MRRVVVAIATAVLAVGLTGCEDEGAQDDVPLVTDPSLPESSDEGIQATGTLDGARIAISDGSPTVVDGDCDTNDGLDADLCVAARTIDGVTLNLVVENPAVLEAGGMLDVQGQCPDECDEVTGAAVIEVRVAGEARPVRRGSMTVSAAGPRFTAEFDLTLPDGDRLIGSFDVEGTPQG